MDPTLESIWEKFHIRLRAFILKRVNNEAVAEDILQDVFIKIHTHLQSLQDTQRIESWIYQIARHAIIDYYRRPDKTTELDESLVLVETDEQECDASCEISSSLRAMVDTLPDHYRQALLLTEFDGLSQQALADQLGISLSGAKSRVQRARQKIKDDLLMCCHFEFDRYGRIVDYWDKCCSCCLKE